MEVVVEVVEVVASNFYIIVSSLGNSILNQSEGGVVFRNGINK